MAHDPFALKHHPVLVGRTTYLLIYRCSCGALWRLTASGDFVPLNKKALQQCADALRHEEQYNELRRLLGWEDEKDEQ